MAILPFSNMSNDPEQEFFSDGITEDIITDLSKVSGLFVLGRNTVFTYKGKAVNLEQIAKELGVAYVVEGSVRKAGNRVRINAQLIEGATGGHFWADRYDRDLTDIFAIQDEITKHDRRPAQGQAPAGGEESDRAGADRERRGIYLLSERSRVFSSGKQAILRDGQEDVRKSHRA